MSAVAFDLDGCLVESRHAIPPSMRVAFESLGLAVPADDELHALIGPPLTLGVASLLAARGEDPTLAPEVVRTYRADYREHMLERTPLMPGVDAVVRALAASRPVCVVTSKPAALATPIVEHLGLLDLLAFVEGPSLEAENESKVVTLRRALDRLPSIGWIVGDRHHDVDAGRANGVRTVGVLWGMGDADELAGADAIVDSPYELLEVLGVPA